MLYYMIFYSIILYYIIVSYIILNHRIVSFHIKTQVMYAWASSLTVIICPKGVHKDRPSSKQSNSIITLSFHFKLIIIIDIFISIIIIYVGIWQSFQNKPLHFRNALGFHPSGKFFFSIKFKEFSETINYHNTIQLT